MTPEETEALALLHKETYEVMKSGFSAMRDSLRMSPELLKCSGYKTNNDAVVGMYKFYQSKVDKLTKEYLRKFPDEK